MSKKSVDGFLVIGHHCSNCSTQNALNIPIEVDVPLEFNCSSCGQIDEVTSVSDIESVAKVSASKALELVIKHISNKQEEIQKLRTTGIDEKQLNVGDRYLEDIKNYVLSLSNQ